MSKRLLLFSLLLCCGFLYTHAQFGIPTEQLTKGRARCGLSAEILASRAVDTSIHSGGGSDAITVPGSFPAAGVDTCGVFCLFYEDIARSKGHGFAEGSGIGLGRRARMCEVVNYIQTVFDFSSIPAGQYIRINIDTSYTSADTAPKTTTWLAHGEPAYPSSGLTNGYVNQFVRTATDPVLPSKYHGFMTFNFDKFYVNDSTPAVINWYEGNGTISNCSQDFFTTALHEICHIMGWISFVSVTTGPKVTGTGLYSTLDTSATTGSFGSMTKVVSGTGSFTTTYAHDIIWQNNHTAPDNYPLDIEEYDAYMLVHTARDFSHMDDIFGSYIARQRISPGDWHDYVMGPYGYDGVSIRTFSKCEIQMLHNMGYSYKSTYTSNPVTYNHVPYSKRMASSAYTAHYASFANEPHVSHAERLSPDFTITNDSNVTQIINFALDTTLTDLDGDSIRIMPNTLVNFRGCGSGGNNHSQLSLNAGNNVITFTPRHNFYGKAQFGANLYDGKEKGGFVIFTIDVKKGNNVRVDSGDNLVLNGNFEEGTEVKRQGGEENINNSSVHKAREGRLMGMHFSDSHPYDWYANPWFPYGGGAGISRAFAACDSSALKYNFGVYQNSFPNPFGIGGLTDFDYVLPPSGGNRYEIIHSTLPSYYYLGDSLRSCKRYVLEFDGYCVNTRLGYEMRVGFTDEPTADFLNIESRAYGNTPIIDSLKPGPTVDFSPVWRHYSIPFYYCGSKPAEILYLRPMGGTVLLDNLSLKQTETPAFYIVNEKVSPCRNTRLTIIPEDTVKYRCDKYHFIWTANGDTVGRDSILYVAPTVRTFYVATVTNGCKTFVDSSLVEGVIAPVVIVKDTSVCYGSSIPMTLSASGIGTLSYSWTPTPLFDCPTCAEPTAWPATDTTVWVTVTDDSGCTKKPVKIKILPLPDVKPITSFTCKGDSVTLFPTGAETYIWSGSTGMSCTHCTNPKVSPPFTFNYIVTGTDSNGCQDTGWVTVRVAPKPLPIITSSLEYICKGASSSLTAHNGVEYFWSPSISLSCGNCANPDATPDTTTEYFVAVVDTNGCVGIDSTTIYVRPLPDVIASASDTSICLHDSTTLMATGALLYYWLPATGLGCATCATTKGSPAATTSYILHGFDVYSCENVDTIQITVRPLPTVSPTVDDTLLCAGTATNLYATGTSVSYSWNAVAGSTYGCSTCATTTVTSSTSGSKTYTVTGTGYNGCHNNASVDVKMLDCACAASSMTSGYTLISGPITGNLSAGNYYIGTNITVYGNPTFTRAKVMVAPNVTITVYDTTKLTLDSCHFFTCPGGSQLWQGFLLAKGSTKSARIEVKNNTMIEDAFIAIKAVSPFTPASGDVIAVNDAVFNRNVQGIYIEDYTSSSLPYPFTVKKTVFTSRLFNSSVITGYPVQWPDANFFKASITTNGTLPPFYIDKNYAKADCKNGYPAEVGIRLKGIGTTSGSGSGVSYKEIIIGSGDDHDHFNLYDNLGYGIDAYNTNLTSYANTFIAIKKAVGYIHPGIGINGACDKTVLRRLRVVQAPTNIVPTPINKFYDCVTGVYANGFYEVVGTQSLFTSSHKFGRVAPGGSSVSDGCGYLVKGNYYKNIDLNDNKLSSMHLGISVISDNSLSSYSDGTININHNNIFNRNPDVASGVSTDSQYVYQGIRIQNILSGICPTCGGVVTGGAYIQANTLDSVYNGIDLLNFKVQTPQVKDNNIWMLKCVDNKRQAGISQTNSIGTISTNNVSAIPGMPDTVRAFYIAQNMRPTLVSNNAIGTGRGFEFVGTQTNTGWFCNYMKNNQKGYVLNGIIGPQGGTSSPYGTVHDNIWDGGWSGKFQTYTLNSPKPLNSILYVKAVTSSPAKQPTLNSAGPLLTPNIYNVGNGIIISSPQAGSACAGPFTSPKQFTGVMHNLIIRGTMPYDHDEAINNWMSQYELYHDLVVDDTLVTNSTQLQSFMAAAASSRFGWLTDIENALTEEDTTTAESLMNSPVSAAGYIEVDTDVVITDTADADYIVQNFVDFYGIYLSYLKGAPIDSPTLVYLSNLCPLTNGTVVYQARSLYSKLYDYNEGYDEDSLCEMNSYARLVRPIAIRQYGLYPNPNDGNLTITQKVKDDVLVVGEVYNLIGQRVYKGELHFAGGVVYLHLGNISPGIYILHLKDDTGTNFTNKFIVK